MAWKSLGACLNSWKIEYYSEKEELLKKEYAPGSPSYKEPELFKKKDVIIAPDSPEDATIGERPYCFKIEAKIEQKLVHKAILSLPVNKTEKISDFDEVSFWARYEQEVPLKSKQKDRSKERNHFCYLIRGEIPWIYGYGITLNEPGVWHYIRIPLHSFSFKENRLEVKSWTIAPPDALSFYLFPGGNSLKLKLGSFWLVRWQMEQDVQEGLRQFFNEMKSRIQNLLGTELMIETFNTEPDNKDNKSQGSLVLQLRTYTVKPDPQRQTWEEEKDTFVYSMQSSELKLVTIGARPPARGYEVYTNLHIFPPKNSDGPKASLMLKDFILQHLSQQRWISIAGRKVPIFLAPQSPENNEKQQDPWENPFLRIKTATWQESGEREYYPLVSKEELKLDWQERKEKES